jgi:HlyD family secretion protein
VVRRGELAERLLLTGELGAVSAENLVVPRVPTWQVAVRWMEADGTAVKAGQRVIEFDSSSFSGTLEEKRLGAAQAERDIDKQAAQNGLSTAEKEFEVVRRALEVDKARVSAAIPAESLPRRVYQERQLELRRAEVALAKAKDELASHRKGADLEMKLRRITLEKARREIRAAELAIASLTLTAPRDGIFVVADHPWEGRKFQTGDTGWVGLTVARLPDLRKMRVVASLSDVDDGRIKAGMAARCTLDAYPDRPLPGRVSEILPVARESARQSLRRAFALTVDLESSDPDRMRPGMSVRVEVEGPKSQGALLAPRASLTLGEAGARARLAGGGDVAVTLGPCNALECVVEKGLAEGMKLGVEGGK